MKLTFEPLELELVHPWAVSRTRAATVARVGIVHLCDPNHPGIQGLGEANPISRYAESVSTAAEFVSLLDLRRLSFANWRESLAYLATFPGKAAARSAVATALFDGAARMAQAPLHDFLDLRFRDATHITSFTIGIDTPEVIRRKTRAAAAFPILKMKVGVAHDAENLAALRAEAPNKLLRVDANEAWKTREEALAQIEWLAKDGHVQFVEQPMPATTPVGDLAWLKERSPLPLFADESCVANADMDTVARGFHGVNVKLAKAGGVYGARDILVAARARGLKTMMGCMIETSVAISAAAHLAELCDYLDLDGHLLITNDPYTGVRVERGCLTFEGNSEPHGLRVAPRASEQTRPIR